MFYFTSFCFHSLGHVSLSFWPQEVESVFSTPQIWVGIELAGQQSVSSDRASSELSRPEVLCVSARCLVPLSLPGEWAWGG